MFHRKNHKTNINILHKSTIRRMTSMSKLDHSRADLPPSKFRVYAGLVFYVLSGTSQPLLVTLLAEAGLTDPKVQLMMLFYYVVPALFLLPFLFLDSAAGWPSQVTVLKACGIAGWDIFSQILNYTGASLAGPTIFAIIYSSVTIWTAVFSQLLLGRLMNCKQWIFVVMVFSGLGITATNSVNRGSNVLTGSVLVIVGSAMHGMTYVLSEGIMTVGQQRLSVVQNNFVQSSFNGGLLLLWQFLYTWPHFDDAVWDPMQEAKTTILYACVLLGGFGALSIIHSLTHFHTLKHYPGGATSAGVMKGLQAVLVFVCTNFLYCNKVGGPEMCFSDAKFAALVTVCGGVMGYVYTTQTKAAKMQALVVERGKEDDETTSLMSASP